MFDALWRRFPHTTLSASGEEVGLPPGQMGNSEVGHLTIGAGRVVFQDLMRINKAIATGAFFENPAARRLRARESEGGNVHLSASSRTAASTRTSTTFVRCSSWRGGRAWPSVRYVHAFTDGRDVSPTRP